MLVTARGKKEKKDYERVQRADKITSVTAQKNDMKT